MLSLAKFIKKEIELRENLVGTGFCDPPQKITLKYSKKLDDGTIEERQQVKSDYRVTAIGKSGLDKTSGFR